MGSTRDTLKRRVRKTVKWGGLVLTVLLVVVWIGSGWWQMYLSGGEGSELTALLRHQRHRSSQDAGAGLFLLGLAGLHGGVGGVSGGESLQLIQTIF